MGRKKVDGIPYDVEMLYILQESRQLEFPSDRIAFFRDVLAREDEEKAAEEFAWEIANKDMADIQDYESGVIDLDMLCKRVARNNYLDRYFKKGIPRDTMLNELRIMGW